MLRTIIETNKSELVIQLPDDLVGKKIELIAFAVDETDGDKQFTVPEWHKEIVRERVNNQPEKLLSWEEVMKELND